LIAAGTSASTDETPADEDGVVVELVAELLLEDELLLPHAAIAPTQSNETGIAIHLLNERITKLLSQKTAAA
jgi:hypothetical protein